LSKKYNEKKKIIDPLKKYEIDEGLSLVKETAWAKFPESVDLAVKLNLSSKKPESVRGLVSLPHGSGKTKRIAVITSSDRVEEAKNNGADVAGSQDLVDQIQKGFLDFDVLLATPDMMPSVGKLGKILGTKGLMPNPKSGTVSQDLKAIKAFKTGNMEFRMDKTGVIHLSIGKVDFSAEKIKDNLLVAIEAIKKSKPSSVKGEYFGSVSISSTMGPGIKLNIRAMETT